MELCFWLRTFVAFAGLASGAALASSLDTLPSVEDGIDAVDAGRTQAYREVLRRFDTAIDAAPGDAALATKRCEFINSLSDDSYDAWAESLSEDLAVCLERLTRDHAAAPEAQLFRVERLWGEEGIVEGEALLQHASEWPAAMRGRLLAHLSQLHEYEDDTRRAGELALQATQLGDMSRATKAMGHLVSNRQFDEAARLLRELPPSENLWDASNRIEVALELPDPSVAKTELRRYEHAAFEIDKVLEGRVHLHAGDVEAASRAIGESDSEIEVATQARFDLALASKDHASAASLVDLTNIEELQANLSRFFTLLAHSPTSILQPSMGLAALFCVLILALVALLPGIVLLPAHYRGLARRARGDVPPPLFDSVGLRHAWLGLAMILIVPMIVGAAIEPEVFMNLVWSDTAPNSPDFLRFTLWGTALTLGCVLLVARRMGTRQLVGQPSDLRVIGWVLAYWLALLAIGMFLASINSQAGGAETLQTRSVDAMVRIGAETWGPVLTLLLIALLIPTLEEITFRGLLLGGLARHIGFGWANALQALLFAAIHDDAPRFPYYFALGLMAGWLVKRTRSLGPAILLHALNNGVATWLRLL